MPTTRKSAATRKVHHPAASNNGEVPFFLAVIVFLIFSLGSVIVAQKMAINYMAREFPRVAENNYRTLQSNLAAAEARLSQKLDAVAATCQDEPGGLLPPPALDSPERMIP
ncbi:MAG: hypothetical protein PHI63_01720 [Patescibacteria group bacterium]|nr:hypothetical protein [Patescibacteria group bacterium]